LRHIGEICIAALFAALIAWPLAAAAEPPPGTLERLKSKVVSERHEAALVLGQAGEMKHTPSLAGLLKDADKEVRDAAYDGLWKI
jgi:HEAT repeat protein